MHGLINKAKDKLIEVKGHIEEHWKKVTNLQGQIGDQKKNLQDKIDGVKSKIDEGKAKIKEKLSKGMELLEKLKNKFTKVKSLLEQPIAVIREL